MRGELRAQCDPGRLVPGELPIGRSYHMAVALEELLILHNSAAFKVATHGRGGLGRLLRSGTRPGKQETFEMQPGAHYSMPGFVHGGRIHAFGEQRKLRSA